MDDVGALGLEAKLHTGTAEEMLDAARMVLAQRILDPDRRDTAALVRELRAVEAQQRNLTPAAASPLDELKLRRERGAG